MCFKLTDLPSPQAQLPTMPHIEFSPVESWNSGKNWIKSLSFCQGITILKCHLLQIYCKHSIGAIFYFFITIMTLLTWFWSIKPKPRIFCFFHCRSAMDNFISFWGTNKSKRLHKSGFAVPERPHQVNRNSLVNLAFINLFEFCT